MPWRADNPVPVLAEAIQRIAAYEPEIDVSHPYFRAVLTGLGLSQAPTAENIDRIADGLPDQGARRVSQGGLAHDRHADDAAGGRQVQQHPGPRDLVCDVRALPGQDDAFVKSELEHALTGLDVSVDVDYTAVSNASPADSPFLDTIRRVAGPGAGPRRTST